MNKTIYLELSILELSKILIYEFWFDCVKPKMLKNFYDEKVCSMDTDSFIVYIKVDDIYKDIAEYVESRSDTSNYELDRPLPKAENKEVIGLMKNELVEKNQGKICYIKSKN